MNTTREMKQYAKHHNCSIGEARKALNIPKKAKKSNFFGYTPRIRIDAKFTATCHDLFHTMYEDKTIDFSKAPYDVWLHGPAFHNGEAVDRDKVDTITLVTPGSENDPRLDPIKMSVKKDGVHFATRHQTYVMNVKETA